MSILRFEGPAFYSPEDESNFFSWIEALGCVRSIRGEVRELIVETGMASDDELRELLAIFRRYRIADWRSLAQFETDSNSEWFRSSEKYWYDLVFGA